MLSTRNKRPVFLTLYQIRFPVTAVLSIIHRITGVLLSIAIPFLIYLLDQSVTSAEGYMAVQECFASPGLRFISGVLVWFLCYHFLAGIRFLIIDLGVGTEKTIARNTAWLIHGLAVLAAILISGVLL